METFEDFCHGIGVSLTQRGDSWFASMIDFPIPVSGEGVDQESAVARLAQHLAGMLARRIASQGSFSP